MLAMITLNLLLRQERGSLTARCGVSAELLLLHRVKKDQGCAYGDCAGDVLKRITVAVFEELFTASLRI